LAALLSLTFPRLGQLWNGEPRRALVFAGAQLALIAIVSMLTLAAAPSRIGVIPYFLLGSVAALLSPVAAVDGVRHARRLGR
jgi:hypothetical protein